MPRYRVIPYRAGSRSATALSRALGGLCLKTDGTSRFHPRWDDVIINWGSTEFYQNNVFNQPGAVRNASNKLNFFNLMRDAGCLDIIPEYWTNREDIPDEAFPIVCRTILAGHSGAGIVIANTRVDLVPAPLYVKYVKKQEEYRIHVGKRVVRNLERGPVPAYILPEYREQYDGAYVYEEQSIIISTQQKRRRLDHDDPNWQVRNHANGFIYARGDVEPPRCVLDAAKRALEATGLDFGAVDVIYNARHGRAYVLEINTAPGLEGQTVDDYVRFFRNDR